MKLLPELRVTFDIATIARYDNLVPHIKAFEDKVWFGPHGICKKVRESQHRGFVAYCHDWTVKIWTLAGRTLFTFENATGRWFSLMVAEDDDQSTMGLHKSAIPWQEIPDVLHYVASRWYGIIGNDDSIGMQDETIARQCSLIVCEPISKPTFATIIKKLWHRWIYHRESVR